MEARAELLALLRHAKDDLDDLPRRLVLADWLEEYGDGVDWARADLLRGHGPSLLPREWFGDLLGHGEFSCDARGFTKWSVPGRTLLRLDADRVRGTEALAWVATLRAASLRGTAVQHLVKSRIFEEIETLDFSHVSIGTEGMAHLARLNTSALRQLNLANNGIQHSGIKRLAQASFLRQLRVLDLSFGDYWSESLQALAQADCSSLRHLRLGTPNLQGGLTGLVSAPWLGSLQGLWACNSMLADESTAFFFRTVNLTSLEELHLSGNRLGRAFIDALTSATLPSLRILTLNLNPLGGEAIPLLAEWPGLKSLRVLGLAWTQMRKTGLEALAKSPYLDQLESLDITGHRSLPDALQQRLAGRLRVESR